MDLLVGVMSFFAKLSLTRALGSEGIVSGE